MSNIIIYATKSLTVTSKLINGNMNKPTITVGSDGIHNYISYLFFDISSIPSNASISSAELVLFKTNNFYNDCR
ncbi:DNRLRE domain-containing protein, partial [Clostridium sp. UBA3887]